MTEKDKEEKIRTESKSCLAAGNWRGFENSHRTIDPGTARFLLNCPQGRIPPSQAQDIFIELN